MAALFFKPPFSIILLCSEWYSFFSPMLGVFMGYTWGIRGVFMGYTYVSGMCRVCIGYVSGKYRRGWGAWGAMDETEKGI